MDLKEPAIQTNITYHAEKGLMARTSLIRFCPNCDSKLRWSRKKSGLSLTCPQCGYSQPVERHSFVEGTPARSQLLILNKTAESLRSMPTSQTTCPRCGNDTAYFWIRQTTELEEPSTNFLRCTKCSYTWREF